MNDTVAGPVLYTELRAWQRETLNRAGLRVVTSATVEPVTLAEVAEHLRLTAYGVEGSSPVDYVYPEQTLIEFTITAAREYIEFLTGLILAPCTLELAARSFDALCRWPGDSGIPLRTGPVTGVSSITYVDSAGATQTLADDQYVLDDFTQPATLFPAYGVNGWPAARDQPNAVRIQFVAGYSPTSGSPPADTIPRSLRAALLLMVGHLYENREETTRGEGGATLLNQIPLGINALVQAYTIRRGFA